MSLLVAIPDMLDIDSNLSTPCMAQVSIQHFICNKCTSEEFSLNAPCFVFTSVEGTSSFSMPPMTGLEIGAFALFLNTSSQFSGQIDFDHLPGFRVSSKRSTSSAVTFTFQADSELHTFMGIEGSASLATATLNTSQIQQLADDLIEAISVC